MVRVAMLRVLRNVFPARDDLSSSSLSFNCENTGSACHKCRVNICDVKLSNAIYLLFAVRFKILTLSEF